MTLRRALIWTFVVASALIIGALVYAEATTSLNIHAWRG
jgi:hypothetical protein